MALDFDSFFEETLKERLQPLERRRKMRRMALRLFPVLLFVVIGTVYSFVWMRVLLWWEFWVLSVLIGGFLAAVFWFFFAEKSLPDEVEETLQNSLPEFLGREFRVKGRLVHYKKFVASQLFNHKTQHYDGENSFEAEMPMMQIEFSELRAGGPAKDGWRDVFWGIFFVAESAMWQFPTPILIVPNRARQGFQHTGDAILAHQYHEEEEELVQISTGVKRHYAVYAGEDKIARGLLSDEFIDTLNEMGKEYPARVALRDGKMYVAIHLGHNWLQPDLHHSLTNPDNLRHYYEVAALGIKLCKSMSMGGAEIPGMENLPELDDV